MSSPSEPGKDRPGGLSYGAWILIVGAALAFRVTGLADRPMHADEAVLAAKFGELLDGAAYRYDPNEHHGPALAWLAYAAARVAGERHYTELTEITLRSVAAFCGILLILTPLLLSEAIGQWRATAAAALMAISPVMVYYSRYFIPEMLLTSLTGVTVGFGYRYARTGNMIWAAAAGASAGLMIVTKETAVIAIACMLIALACTARIKQINARHATVAIGLAIAIPLITFGVTGALQAVRSYTQRALDPVAHHHPWYYYLGIVGWTEAFILGLAALQVALLIRNRAAVGSEYRMLRFLAVYAGALTMAYSLIPYKTPWCILGPMQAMILLAGSGAVAWLKALNGTPRIVVAALLVVAAGHLAFQAWRVSFPLSSDPKNPYVYAHTGRDVYLVRDSIDRLAGNHPQGRGMPLQVVGSENLWPLPWYFRGYTSVGWWRQLGPGFRPADVIVATPGMEPALVHEIYEVPPPGSRELYRSLFDHYVELRPGVELRGYVRASLADLSEK